VAGRKASVSRQVIAEGKLTLMMLDVLLQILGARSASPSTERSQHSFHFKLT
jgi:hypothetical protein